WEKHCHDVLREMNPQDIQFRIRRKDGEIRWIEHVCQPVIDAEGRFMGVRASNRDITKRKRAQEKLNDTLSLLSATLESTEDGILVVDKSGKMVCFNQKFVQMWRIPESIAKSRSDAEALAFVSDQMKEPERFLSRVKDLYEREELEVFEVLEFKDGRVFERYSRPQKIGSSIIGRVWSFRDVTEREKAAKALRESEQLLIQAHKMEAVGRLAAGVAHEINNPLAIINENAGLMKDILELSEDYGSHKEKILHLIGSIFEGVDRCRTITHRLLGFSRRTDVTYEAIDLNASIKEVIGFLEKEIVYRNITLHANLKNNMPSIVGDKGQLQQVLLNILNNAIDAVEKGGEIRIASGEEDEHTVFVEISDNGHGIPQAVLEHIFEPFYTTKKKGEGTGLGLSISYGIMQKLGGQILVQSEVGKGTTFVLKVPKEVKQNAEV
ncbi:MAG: ATP-binding protein, partial [Nitrospirota bacterium]